MLKYIELSIYDSVNWAYFMSIPFPKSPSDYKEVKGFLGYGLLIRFVAKNP